jgi:hypothetical protein
MTTLSLFLTGAPMRVGDQRFSIDSSSVRGIGGIAGRQRPVRGRLVRISPHRSAPAWAYRGCLGSPTTEMPSCARRRDHPVIVRAYRKGHAQMLAESRHDRRDARRHGAVSTLVPQDAQRRRVHPGSQATLPQVGVLLHLGSPTRLAGPKQPVDTGRPSAALRPEDQLLHTGRSATQDRKTSYLRPEDRLPDGTYYLEPTTRTYIRKATASRPAHFVRGPVASKKKNARSLYA